MRELAAICAIVAGVTFLGGFVSSIVYERGHRRGFREGQKWGADQAWHEWVAMEVQVQREREKIWREET